MVDFTCFQTRRKAYGGANGNKLSIIINDELWMPKLPATTLSPSCYREMFSGCTSLNESSELRAATLTNYCYYRMFYNCKKLDNITMVATEISAQGCLGNWVNGVAATGTFVKAPSMTSLTTGVNGIPKGWTKMNDMNYLTLTALSDGSIIIDIPSVVDSSVATSISYSKNKSKWVTIPINSNDQTIADSVSKDENVYLKGIAKSWNNVAPDPHTPLLLGDFLVLLKYFDLQFFC